MVKEHLIKFKNEKTREIMEKKYRNLNPKLIFFCKKLIKEQPHKKRHILKILDILVREKRIDEYFGNPPWDWGVENYEKDYVLFFNGVFWIELKELSKNNYLVSLDASYGKFKFPFRKRTKKFDNVFRAIFFIDNLKVDLDKQYFGENNEEPEN